MFAMLALMILQEKPVRLVPYTAERGAHSPSGDLMGRKETDEEKRGREALEAEVGVGDLVAIAAHPKVVVDPDLSAQDRTVDLRLNDVKVRTLLDLLRGYEVGWYVGEGFIMLCLPEEQARRRTELRTYDLRDLLVRIIDFPGEALLPPAESDTALSGATFGVDEPSAVTIEEDMIAELIQVSIEPETWDSYNHSIDLMGGVLFVRHLPEVQEQVFAFIEGLRSRSQIQIVTEAKLFALTEERIEALRRDGPTVDAKTLAGEALLGTADVICFNTQRTSASRLERRSHVGAYVSQVADSSAQAEPKTRVVNEGVQLDVRPIASADRRSVTLELRFDMTDLMEMKIAKTGVGDLDQPQVTTYGVTSTISVPSGAWVVVGSLGDYQQKGGETRRAVLVVRATIYGIEN